MEETLGWSVIEVPIIDGTILLEFFSGNIAYLADRLTVSSIGAAERERLKQLGIVADGSAKLQPLEKRWGEVYLNETKATKVFVDLTHQSLWSSDIAQTFLRTVISQEGKDDKQIVLGIVAGKNPIEEFLTDEWVEGTAPYLADKLEQVFIVTEDPQFVMARNLVSLQRFLSLIFTKWGKSYKVFLAVILSNPKEIVDYLTPIRRLRHQYGLTTAIYLKADEAVVGEKLAEFGDVIFRHQLYSLIPTSCLIPASTTLHDLLFGCTYFVNAKFYSKLFSVLFKEHLLRMVSIGGGGVLKSIDYFIKRQLFFPPNLVRCGSGHTVFLKNSKAYCCSKEVRRQIFVDLEQESSVELLTGKLSDYRKSQFLYGGITNGSLLTYGGVCPHQPLEIQSERGLKLLSSFFEQFVCAKRGEVN